MKFGTRLAFLFILVGFLPLLVGGFFGFYFFDSYLRETTYSNLDKISEITSFQVENFIEQSLSSAVLLSRNDIIFSKESTIEKIQEEVDSIYDYYGGVYEEVIILDSNGGIIVSTAEKSEDGWGDVKWFKEARETGEVVASDMYIDPVSGNPVISIFVPNEVYLSEEKDEKEIYFTVAKISTESLFRSLDFPIGVGGGVALISAEGNIIFHRDEEKNLKEVWENYPLDKNFSRLVGVMDIYLDGERFIASFRTIRSDVLDSDWQVLVMQPEEEAFGFLRTMVINYGLLSIIFLFPIILASFFISKKTMKPLKNLSITSKRVARGDFKAKAIVYSKDELGELAENFNKMTKELGEAKKTMEEERDILEIKVNARTKELNQTNERLEEEVQKRTEQMQRKISELEKMSKLMVGRELRMKELKKEIEEAREEIERLKGEE